jgi:hypothetical protein
MAKQDIDIGVEGNDGTGDSIRESFRKVNENFTEIYAVFGAGGQISFLALSDTPNSLVPGKLLRISDAGDAIEYTEFASDEAEDPLATDSITFSYDTAGKIILKTSFRAVAQDLQPSLGAPLDADGRGIARVAINNAAVIEFNATHGGDDITIDDLVITKGYADNRYIAGDLAIRVDDEPLNDSEYNLIIASYTDGNIVISGHGFDRTINGTPYVFQAEDTDPSGLVSGVTYYLRYASDDQLSVHATRADAEVQSQAEADGNRIFITALIADDDIHKFVDAAYDETLTGFFLSNEAMPRKSIVRRTGDTMTGPLILHDSPGELAGLTNSREDLQAATKFYVDNTSYSSPSNLFVSTSGDDTMAGVPAGKAGTSQSYAYRTINAAAQRAEEIMKASLAEPGPYFQTITKDNGATPANTVSVGFVSPRFAQARTLIQNNREYVIREVSAYLNFVYPDFEYNVATCERDVGLILDAIAFDINKSPSSIDATANNLTRIAAERYYASPSSKIAITRQRTETVDAIEFARDVIASILINRPFGQTVVSNVTQAAIPTLSTATNHGLVDSNIVVVKNVVGMTELNENFYYVKVTGVRTLELFSDEALTLPVDTRGFTEYTSGGIIGLVYQTDAKQTFDIGNDAGAIERQGVTDKFNLVTNIINNGIDAGASVVYGSTYKIVVENGGLTATDQGNISNRDVLPGKILVGKISGAQGRIVSYTTNSPSDSGDDVIQVNLLKAIDFIEGEDLEYGNYVNQSQVTIFVETGIYEEDYPIKVPANVSIKGDEFRRVIVRPKDRLSQSPWAGTYIYRDREFDGITVASAGARFYNQTNEWQGHFGYHYLTNPEKVVNTGIAVANVGEYESAANILRENKAFIQNEVISYINNNYKDMLYDKNLFEDDLAAIINGVTYDLVLGTNFNAVSAGLKYFQRTGSVYLDDYLKALWVVGLTEAKRIAAGLPAVVSSATAVSRVNAAFDDIINIIENGVIDTDTAADTVIYGSITSTVLDDSRAVTQLTNNREFIAQEGLAYLKSLAPRKYFDEAVRLRDFRNLTDAVCYDVQYGGNFGITEFARSLFIGDVSRLEITTRIETVETLDYLASVLGDIVQQVAVTPTTGNSEVQVITGTAASSTAASKIDVYLQIVEDQVNNDNILSIPSNTYPSLVSGNAALVDAKSGIDGAITTIQSSVITEIDDVAVFSYNQAKCSRDTGLIVDALIDDLLNGGDEFATEVQGQYFSSYIQQYNNGGFGGQENVTKAAIENIVSIASRLFLAAYDPSLIEQNTGDADYIAPDFKYGTAEVGTSVIVSNLINKIVFAFDRRYNPPLRNDEMDVFLMNDASLLRNMTVQGHGGFLTVLDPAGQVLTKSPYVQTGSSFSKSVNRKIFGGGMFVDAYAGNLPAYIPSTIDVGDGPISGKVNNFELWVRSEDGQGLFVRPPELPCPFYIEGRRYQVTAISNYDQGNGWCKIYLDATSNGSVGYNENQFEEDTGNISRSIYLQTAGNRSMLGNDFTQINDLGYGLVTNNGAFSEMVSMFTYYCQAAFYAKNGSEIRSLNGSNGYGNFGLVSEGADPNEIPDQVTYEHNMTYPVKTVTFALSGDDTNIETSSSLFVTDAVVPPQPNSIVVVDHGGLIGVKRYRISAVSISTDATPTGGVYSDVLYRLQLSGTPAGENEDFYSTLQADIADGTFIEYRSSETHQFNNIRDITALVTRPSTAINFDESDDITYRSISFANTNNYGDTLDSDSIIATFEIPFDVIELPVDFANSGSGKGSTIGDTSIAIRTDDDTGLALDPTEILRLTRDIAGRQPGDAGYTGGMIFSYAGRTHQIIGFTDNGAGSATIDIASAAVTDITAGGTGIAEAFTADRVLYAALPASTTAEITISISLCRATGHDFTQIGTGSFNDSNYPNVILGQPVNSLAPYYTDSPNATSGQVWERRKGRVFWMSTDQYGFFRVGKFFEVDQGQGSIKFSGEIGITGANALGFKKGVTIDEFSIDDSMADESDSKVPVEKAIVQYINKRLGRDKNDTNVSAKIGPGFLPLSGTPEMTGDLQMGTNKITNLQNPDNGSDAATKVYVDSKILDFDNFNTLRNTSESRTQAGDILVYTGLKKILVTVPSDSAGSQVFAVDDSIRDVSSTKSAIIKDIVQTTDDIVGEFEPGNNIWIIVYELQGASPDFNVGEDIEGTSSKATVSSNILRGPFDEIAHARESDTSVINVTVTRTKSVLDDALTDPIAEIDFQLENGSVIDADISASANIAQSKLLMDRAKPLATSTGLYGTGDAVGQASRGLAAFEADNFVHEIRLTLASTLTANAGDILYQGALKGTVVNTIVNNTQVVIRTSDAWASGATVLALAEIIAGVERIAVSQPGVTVTSVNASGFIGLKDRSIGFDKLDIIATDNLLGRFTDSTGSVEAVPFATVIDQGFGLQDEDFEDSEITLLTGQRINFASNVSVVDGETITQNQGGGVIRTGIVQGTTFNETSFAVVSVSGNFNTAAVTGSISGSIGTPTAVTVDVNLTGSVLVKQAEGIYGTTAISTGSSNNSIARRTSTGALQANSFIIGGSSTNEILSESGNTLTFKTPGQGVILTANGTGSLIIQMPGSLNIGTTGVTDEGNAQGNIAGLTGKGFSAAPWMYTNFIEALDTKESNNSTGIGLGASAGYASSAAQAIVIVNNNSESLVTTGSVVSVKRDFNVASTQFTVASASGNTTVNGTMSIAGDTTVGGGYGSTGVTITSAGNISANGSLTVDGAAVLSGDVDLGNSATDTISFTGVVDTNILPTGTRNIGSATAVWSTVYATTFSGTATTAKYADLAENYLADAEYEPGTVVVLGGEQEVTTTSTKGDRKIAGVISTQPAHLMNSVLEGEFVVAVALTGRVPCKVLGAVEKGDILVSSAIPGYAMVDNDPKYGTIIGKAIGNKVDTGKGVVEILVGKS